MSTTTNLGLTKPDAGDTEWASDINTNWDTLDSNVAVVKAIDHTWEGNDNNNREIDLSDDYQRVEVFYEEPGSDSQDHLAMAFAFGTCYGFFQQESGKHCNNFCMSSANSAWQGKMSGADQNKVKCGSDGSYARGTNYNGKTYRLCGMKFSSME